ncbi:hypothetical protein [Thiohalobacter thiocyanaticus]|uniref:Uncharacterized protein n=1 Tax=Thiohalobacter thiocyanaticus TaxID=585455 RepID=A0A426QFW3_9GAMM|nr:hypothetical protein [Thiohalobacter thiocyanaticus]RRQ20633.1 hypothetical protein D6C00_00630 [Thiohalobacter thiocyanaticus]
MTGTPTQARPARGLAQTLQEGSFTVFLQGRPITATLTPRARKAAESLGIPMVVEMELFFSCLLRKRLRFHQVDAAPESVLEPVELYPGLSLLFRPVVAEVCNIDTLEGAPPVKTMPAKRADAFIPKWVSIDHRSGAWAGDFGY